MSDTDQSRKIELDEVMLAMDVVDTLRHQQSVVDRELGAEDHEQALIEKVRKIYAGQGLTVSDEVIAEGVRALREERFSYRPPQKSFQLTLARLYVNRGRWAKRGALVITALLAIVLVYQFAVVAPQKRARQQQQRALQELEAMPAKLADQRNRVLAEAHEDAARLQAEALYRDAMAAVSRQDSAAVDKGVHGPQAAVRAVDPAVPGAHRFPPGHTQRRMESAPEPIRCAQLLYYRRSGCRRRQTPFSARYQRRGRQDQHRRTMGDCGSNRPFSSRSSATRWTTASSPATCSGSKNAVT